MAAAAPGHHGDRVRRRLRRRVRPPRHHDSLDQRPASQSAALWPVRTFAVNASGSLLFGLTAGLANHHGLPWTGETVFGVGFLGGYTTLSTWAWESLALTLDDDDDDGGLGRAALNVIGTLTVCAAAAADGLGIMLL